MAEESGERISGEYPMTHPLSPRMEYISSITIIIDLDVTMLVCSFYSRDYVF